MKRLLNALRNCTTPVAPPPDHVWVSGNSNGVILRVKPEESQEILRFAQDDKMRRTAFTLAEVLITLAIIGVVAALTIPTLIQNYQKKQLHTKLVKTYSLLRQALDMEYVEAGQPVTFSAYRGTTPTDKLNFKNMLIKHLKVTKDCKKTMCIINNYTNKYVTYNKSNATNLYLFDDGQFMLNTGEVVLIENPNRDLGDLNAQIMITVDINGLERSPNAWGHDLFTFQLLDNKGLVPSGAKGTTYENSINYCSKTSTSNYNGVGCTEKALNDPNYWKELPK